MPTPASTRARIAAAAAAALSARSCWQQSGLQPTVTDSLVSAGVLFTCWCGLFWVGPWGGVASRSWLQRCLCILSI